jgi:hypothetical protein
MILLIDKSLSMASCIEEAKAYAAAKVIEPILVPGDRLIIEAVYGKVDRLLSMSIASEQDKATAIRSIRSLKADGRFTDLGAGLDAAKKDLDELGQPERPKYVLLISDERQEAPMGSPYVATDYKLKHPSLEYVKRVDLGQFHAITIGFQVGAKVEIAAPAMMELLKEAPVREGAAIGGAGRDGSGAASAGSAAKSSSQAGADSLGSTGSRIGGSMAATKDGAALERAIPAWLLYAVAALFAAALIGLALALALSKKKAKETASTQ